MAQEHRSGDIEFARRAKPKNDSASTGAEDHDEVADDSSFWHAFKHESAELMKLALPIMATSCLSFVMQVVDLAMVGHLGREELAAAALANAFFATVVLPLTGAAMAFDTLFSQSFGAKNYVLYGQWLLVGSILIAIMAFPFLIVLIEIENVMLAIKLDPHMSAKAAQFIQLLLPGFYPFLAFTVLTKYLQSQHILKPSVIIALIANIFNAVCNFVLIYVAGLGFVGAPIATSLSRTFQLLALSGFLFCSKQHRPTWPRINISSLKELQRERWWEFSKLGSSGYLMLALELWAFELCAILAAYIGTVTFDAHSAVRSVSGLTYVSFPLALSIAVSIRIGNLLGSNDPRRARMSAKAGIVLNLVVALGLVVVLLLVREHLGRIFSSDGEVVRTVAIIVPIVCLYQVFDCTQSLVAGCFRGMGRQGIVTRLNLVGFWLIGIPLGGALTFKVGGSEGGGMGLVGLWWGLAAGLGSTSLFGLVVLFQYVDWEKQAGKAVERNRHGGGNENDDEEPEKEQEGNKLEKLTLQDSLAVH